MPKRSDYQPNPLFTDLFPEISGNEVNGLGETEPRRASPFFWHPPPRQSHGALQAAVTDFHRHSPELRRHFSPTPPGGRGPKPIEQAPDRIEQSPQTWTDAIKSFSLSHEADLVGIAAMDERFLFEGYESDHPFIIVIGVAMDYSELSQVPATAENPAGAVVVAREYNRASRASREIANQILSQGWAAKAYPGPYASALNMIPAAIEAGLGELGKHGSIINRELGSSFRLSAVTTDLPLVVDTPDDFGADDYCTRCQACVRACPPDAIYNKKQMVRGESKWYVDFDKCIPYFGETFGCGICIAICPFSRPGNAPRLIERMQKKK
ncbi:MAG: 4Fe-4S dicluster domain-containing protein [Pseudomonadota bacterium]